jgi:micrococcal nuclease
VSIRETQNNQPKDTYSVKKVIDGDTLEIERYGKAEKVRMIGIDTPETLDPRKPVQCFGKEASDKSKDLLSGGRVRLEFDPIVGEKDKYNRLLAYVWSDNELVNLKLIKEGYANEYTYRSQSYKYQNEFKNAQTVAKESSIGLWSPQTCNGKTK